MNALELLVSKSNIPSVNLAFEEYLLTQKKDYLLFYINSDAVVLGKHQNPWKEIDMDYCSKHGIEVLRRLSGGGTVFHDLGNINFSYIRSKQKDFVNFREHIEPLSRVLTQMGIENRITDRNDIFIADKKISGNAEHLSQSNSRILHHGTLLFNSDLNKLRNALVGIEDIRTHAVASVSSPVTQISEFTRGMNTEAFFERLLKLISSELEIEDSSWTDPSKLDEVMTLSKSKYESWGWTFGHVPMFEYETNLGTIKVRKAVIQEVNLKDKDQSIGDQIIGERYKADELLQRLGPDKFKRIKSLILPS